MGEKYDHQKIEKKWQKRWEEAEAFRAQEDKSKKKTYLLIEFPYPSGDGLHVGHIRSWTALDIVARKRRMQGENVLYPIGWDAFGLPAENYALKTGIHPAVSTKQNTDNFRRQIKSLGLSFDWSREVNTTDPAYYKWTQWIFLQLFKHGLAYKARTTINWCPSCKIGLANEEVVDGACERCGTPVEKREKEQWMLAITKYAKRLYDDLDTVNYIERAKVQQRNWIGPSEGAEIDFSVMGSAQKIRVFTTRPDTLFGATYMVLAPEHPLVGGLAAQAENKKEIEKYIAAAGKKTEIERTAEGKEKTGVEIKGVRAINPASKGDIPIFVADYVLSGYGTGAIMAVPAHDERDYEFAKKFNLPIRRVVEPKFVATSGETKLHEGQKIIKRNAICAIIRNPKDDTYLCNVWKNIEMRGLLTGGVDEGEDMIEAAMREIREETGYKNVKLVQDPQLSIHTFFYHRQKNQNRHARFHYLFFELENEEREPINPEELAKHEFVWKTRKELENFFTVFEGYFILNFLDNPDYIYVGPGIIGNSPGFDGLTSEEAKKKITQAVGGEERVIYKLRDWVFSRQRYWGEPIPMVHCTKDGWVGVPESELPVVLPQIEKYQPNDAGESPLANIEEWVATTCPTCGGPARRETDVMPNWAGSSWYYLRYADPKNERELASKEKLKYWTPVDWYNGGMEHTTLHLLYSRFWHKFLFDIGIVPTPEPYHKRTSHGLILAEGGEKMSKSKGNVINPDSIVERHGADALRLYEMFIGPFEQSVAWNDSSIAGVKRFLERVWRLEPSDTKIELPLDSGIQKISNDIESLKFNTAVSTLMIMLNTLEDAPEVSRKSYATFMTLLHPFAPHLTAELAQMHGIDLAQWPTYDESKLKSSMVTIAVQVNGKTRATIELPHDTDEESALAAARKDPATAKWLAGKQEKKALYVPRKIVSFVVDSI